VQCVLIGVFPCVFSFRQRPTTAFFRFSNCLPVNSKSSIISHQTSSRWLLVCSPFLYVDSLLYFHPSLPSFETSRKTPRIIFSLLSNAPKSYLSYPLHPYQRPILSPPCRPYLILRSHGFTLHLFVRLPVMSCPTLSPTYMSLYSGCLFAQMMSARATLLQWITIMAPWYRSPCKLIHQTILCETIRRVHRCCCSII